MINEIKKQIDRQTRPNVGNINIKTDGSRFVEQSVPQKPETYPTVMWDKVWYTKNRGAYADMSPSVFNDVIAQKSTQQISTNKGNFTDVAKYANYNARYSGWIGKSGGGRVSFRLRGSLFSASVWLDDRLIYTSGESSNNSTDINLYIQDTGFVQIFFYSASANKTISIEGDMAKYIDRWGQSDVTPFLMPVEWYPTDPIISDSLWQNGYKEYNRLKWWFGDEWEVEEIITNEDQADRAGSKKDIGGFGVWQIEFFEIGDLDWISEDFLSVSGFYPNIEYWRIVTPGHSDQYTVFHSTYVNTTWISNKTLIYIPSHGLAEPLGATYHPPVLSGGVARHMKDIPLDSFSDIRSGVFETKDMEIERGKTYYYLIDTYDTSSNKNRGGMTSSYQSIVAGDTIPPNQVTNLTGYASSYDSITIEYDPSTSTDAIEYCVWTDTGATVTATIIEGTYEYCFINNNSTFKSGDNITIDWNDNKYTRKIESVTLGGKITYVTPLPVEAGSGGGGTVRLLSLVTTNPLEKVYTVPLPIPLPYYSEPV